ncbi:MAG: ABC transporter permease [Lachnospiraceae bacterium]|nr:ABC transporter permease [Lachnospiraceae bacterium]
MSILSILKANLRSKKSNFISVLFLMFLVTLVVTTACSVRENCKKRAEQSLTESGVGDLFCGFNENVLTEEMIDRIEAYEEVERVYRIFCVMISSKDSISIGGKEIKDSMLFQTYDEKNMPYPVFGKNNLEFLQEPEPLAEGEIYLPVSFQTQYSCKVGDQVKVKSETISKTFQVKAFVEDMTFGNPLFGGTKNVWISHSDYEMLKKAYEKGDTFLSSNDKLMVYQKKGSKLEEKEFKNEIDKRTGIISNSTLTFSKNDFIFYATTITNIFSAVILVFAVLMFAGVLGIVGHSITSTIEMDYVNLGILKSQGYRKWQLQAVYVCQYLLAGAVGGLLGFSAAFPSTYFMSGQLVQITGFLPEHKISYGISLVVMFLMLCFIVGFAFIKTGKIGKISPMRAISGGRDCIYFSPRIKTTLGKRGLAFRMMLRQITTNVRQYISSLVLVAMLVYFIMAVTSTLSCLNEEHMLKDYYGIEFDLMVTYKESLEVKKDVEKLIEEYGGMERGYLCPVVYLTLDGDPVSVIAPESSQEFTNVFKGREPRYENEIAITEIIAKKYDLKIGDTVSLSHGSENREFLITGYFQSVQNTGKVVSILTSGLKRYEFSNHEINQYNYLVSDKEQIGSLVEKLQEHFGSQIVTSDVQGIRERMQSISAASMASSLLIYGISVLFILVVAYMVCDKVFLKERNDYGIYKSQGFTTANLRLQFSLRFLAVAFAGGAFGGACNILTNDKFMTMALSTMGITHFVTDYGFMDYAVPVMVLALVFFFFAYLISGRMKKVDTKSLIVE